MEAPFAKGGAHVNLSVVFLDRPGSGFMSAGSFPRIGGALVVCTPAALMLPLLPRSLMASTATVKL